MAFARAASCAAALSAAISGCGSGHPTVASHPTHASPFVLVRVHNDTPSAVKILQCLTTSCTGLHERLPIPAGGETRILGSNEGLRFGYLVEDTAGKRLGCLYMKFAHDTRQPIVPVSSMGRCE